MTVKKYNRIGERKYRKAFEECNYPKETFPTLGQYCFINQHNGELKKSGYVGVYNDGKGAIWRKTKKEVIEYFKKEQ